jgi:hypothetical protein
MIWRKRNKKDFRIGKLFRFLKRGINPRPISQKKNFVPNIFENLNSYFASRALKTFVVGDPARVFSG